MAQFRGKRLFAGRLFAGQLFGAEPRPQVARGSWRQPVDRRLVDLRRQRLIEDEDLLAAVLIAAIPGLMRRQ